jgi:hypothetical protein
MLPLSTTLVLEKPAPDQAIGQRQAIDLGIKSQTYRFILRDAYVDDPGGKWTWSSIWQAVRQSRPNLQIQGPGDPLVTMKPGEVVTVKGMCTILTRSLEVSSIEPGGPFAPKHSY